MSRHVISFTRPHRTANRENGARLNIVAESFRGRGRQCAFCGVRVFNPFVQSYRNTALALCYRSRREWVGKEKNKWWTCERDWTWLLLSTGVHNIRWHVHHCNSGLQEDTINHTANNSLDSMQTELLPSKIGNYVLESPINTTRARTVWALHMSTIKWGSLTLAQLQFLIYRQAMQLTCNVNMQRCTDVTLIRSQAREGSLALLS